jgi:ATP-dependent RNA helicase DeaD
MTQNFEDIGLRAELIGAVAHAGYERPSAIQRASVPVLRRGGNVIIHGSTGSGALTGTLLALLDRLAGDDSEDKDGVRPDAGSDEGVAVVVVTSTDARASRIAEAAAKCGEAFGTRAAAVGGGWSEAGAMLLVGTTQSLMRGVQRSIVKLDAVRAVVVDGAAQIHALGGGQELEALLQVVPRDAQRVIISAELTPDVVHLAEAHARRALHVPARSADPLAPTPAVRHPEGDVGYVIAAGNERFELLARLLADYPTRRRAVVARTAAAAETLSAAIARRGWRVGLDEAAIRVVRAGARPDADLVIGFGAPLDAADFSATFLSGDVFVVSASELAHLRATASEANLELKPLSPSRAASPTLDAFRTRIRRALDEEDIDAQLLVLEPLFDERSPAEVAAALSGLLRRRRDRESAATEAAGSRETTGAQPAGGAFVRLFFSAGARDNLRPADIVGAIAGEAGVPGGQVGRIEIRDTFSVVEVPADAAEKVIRALNGTTMRGRSLRVDFDRKGGVGAPARPRRTRPG